MIKNTNDFIEIKNVIVSNVNASIDNLDVNIKAIKTITFSLKIFFIYNLVIILKSTTR